MAKILAVDDEPAILEMIESILNKDGHLVTKVSNPLKINMEELHRYDLILLDIMMPGIDGFELCKRIRILVDCPILFLTAKTEENSLVNPDWVRNFVETHKDKMDKLSIREASKYL